MEQLSLAEPDQAVAAEADDVDAEPGTTVTVYKYGVPARWQPPDELRQQVVLAHRLRNALVEIDLVAEKDTAAVWAGYPPTAGFEAAVAEAQTAVDAANAALLVQRREDRTAAPDEVLAAAERAARAVLAAAKTERKKARDAHYPTLKPVLLGARKVADVKIKALYADFVQDRGLYWATYNDVVDRHRTARKRIAAARKKGRPAGFKFHRFTGEGTVSVQLQRKQGVLRSPEALAAVDGRWRNVLQVRPWVHPDTHAVMSRGEQRAFGQGTARFTLGRQHPAVEVPVQVHRMLPAEAEVVAAALTCRPVAGGERWALTVVARVPAPVPAGPGPAVAVHLGWRAMPDGSLRVATWQANAPLNMPPRLAMVHDGSGKMSPLVLRDPDGMSGEVRLPASWRKHAGRFESLTSIRDTALDVARKALAAHLDTHGPLPGRDEDDPPVTAADVRRWEAPGRFAALAIRLRDVPPEQAGPEQAEAIAALEAWRKQDKHLWEWAAHGRNNHRGRRFNWYLQIGAWLAGVASTVVLDDVAPGTLTRVPRAGEEDDPQARAARGNRQQAAPGDLREKVRQAAVREGVRVVEQASAGVAPSGTHYTCGVRHPRPEEYAAQPVVWCPTCQVGYDQDRNAAMMLLAAAGQVPPPGLVRQDS